MAPACQTRPDAAYQPAPHNPHPTPLLQFDYIIGMGAAAFRQGGRRGLAADLYAAVQPLA